MQPIDRLSAIDSSFLRIETESAHMHVGWLAMLELPEGEARLDLNELRTRIAGRLHLAPRFRQRVLESPLGGEPVWEDDPGFRLEDHVRELPVTFAGLGLRRLTDAFFSAPLARDRPLWELVLVPRLADGRAVLLGKIHHAMVDGVAAVELGMLLFDVEPEAPCRFPEPWSPAPAPSPLRLALDTIADQALVPWRLVRWTLEAVRSPRRGFGELDALRHSVMSLAADAIKPAPQTYLNVPIGPRRTLVTHEIELERLLALRSHAGVKLNDVVLAVCAGALRRFALDAGERPVNLRVMVPVNVRSPGNEAASGNRISFGFLQLPVGSDCPQERMRLVRAQMDEIKADGRIQGGDKLIAGLGMLPEPARDAAARFAASPRLYNVIVSNVPGPRITLYAACARVRSIHPVIPMPDEHALSIGVLTYNGTANFAFYADPDALPNVAVLAMAIEEAVIELEDSYRPWASFRPVPEPGPHPNSDAAPRHGAPRHRGDSASKPRSPQRDGVLR
jgi:WS/DGAT/MGAT family acyltransferase